MPLIKDPKLKVGKLMVCAMYELEYISKMQDPAEVVRAFWENPEVTLGPRIDSRTVISRKPFILFSATTRPLTRHIEIYKAAHENPGYGKDLKKYIEDNNLGLVTESEERQNGTGNWLKIYLWHIDWDKLASMMKPLDAEEYKQWHAEQLEKAKLASSKQTPSQSGMVEALNRFMAEELGNVVTTNNTSGSSR